MRAVLRTLLASAGAWSAGSGALPQGQARNDPSRCSWCEGVPERMAAAGIASHGGFEFGTHDTAWVDRFFAGRDVFWIESEHFELGLCVSAERVDAEDAKKIRAELSELAEHLPAVNPKARVLDPFQRAHLYALRLEKTWDRFLELMGAAETDFPDGIRPWALGTPYWGEGPYLGQKGKFELIVLPTAADQVAYLKQEFGLSVRRTQRWNVMERSSMIVVTNLAENELTSDARLHGHLVFNTAINLLDGFKHYAYDTPHWLREGLGHFMEREINPRFNTFDASEGSLGVRVNREDWDAEAKQLIASGKAPRLAEMVALESYGAFELRHHTACWSMTRFLVETNPQGYACLNGKLHGRKRADGFPDSEDLAGVHRAAVEECLGLSYAQFDEAWRAWALAR
jgi:hypothetical protein